MKSPGLGDCPCDRVVHLVLKSARAELLGDVAVGLLSHFEAEAWVPSEEAHRFGEGGGYVSFQVAGAAIHHRLERPPRRRRQDRRPRIHGLNGYDAKVLILRGINDTEGRLKKQIPLGIVDGGSEVNSVNQPLSRGELLELSEVFYILSDGFVISSCYDEPQALATARIRLQDKRERLDGKPDVFLSLESIQRHERPSIRLGLAFPIRRCEALKVRRRVHDARLLEPGEGLPIHPSGEVAIHHDDVGQAGGRRL
mmetsp:Transcript_64888/g.146355  ORF Transcript_64888/g.146355 Transcript_64888/m.146355 type:complete len:254 (-) Transcript_64888:473-1234(-)